MSYMKELPIFKWVTLCVRFQRSKLQDVLWELQTAIYLQELYNPTIWGKESFYDELAKAQKIEMDKRERERKDRTKVYLLAKYSAYSI